MINNQNSLKTAFNNQHTTPVGFIGGNMFNFTSLMYDKNNDDDYTILYIIGFALVIFIYKVLVILNQNDNDQEKNHERIGYNKNSTAIPIFEMSHVSY